MTTPRLRAQLHTCGHCHALVILALDAPTAALTIRADPLPLDAHAELAARLAGRTTYDLIPAGHHHEIAERDQYRIRHRHHPVLAAHQCPGPIPATAHSPSAEPPAAGQLTIDDQEEPDDRPPY